MIQFQCDKCGDIFKNEGEVLEYNSPIYGPCSKKIADCPDCGSKSDEYRPPKQARSKSMSHQNAMPPVGGCSSGGCCCAGQS